MVRRLDEVVAGQLAAHVRGIEAPDARFLARRQRERDGGTKAHRDHDDLEADEQPEDEPQQS